jgi:hypothetical protein
VGCTLRPNVSRGTLAFLPRTRGHASRLSERRVRARHLAAPKGRGGSGPEGRFKIRNCAGQDVVSRETTALLTCARHSRLGRDVPNVWSPRMGGRSEHKRPEATRLEIVRVFPLTRECCMVFWPHVVRGLARRSGRTVFRCFTMELQPVNSEKVARMRMFHVKHDSLKPSASGCWCFDGFSCLAPHLPPKAGA